MATAAHARSPCWQIELPGIRLLSWAADIIYDGSGRGETTATVITDVRGNTATLATGIYAKLSDTDGLPCVGPNGPVKDQSQPLDYSKWG